MAGSLGGSKSCPHLAVLLICLLEESLPLTADQETEDSPMFVRKVTILLKFGTLQFSLMMTYVRGVSIFPQATYILYTVLLQVLYAHNEVG